jgi:hypothetical protein
VLGPRVLSASGIALWRRLKHGATRAKPRPWKVSPTATVTLRHLGSQLSRRVANVSLSLLDFLRFLKPQMISSS